MTRETILVVDDNLQISNFLAGTVLPNLGYEPLVAYDGMTALQIIKEHHHYLNLILLDLQLPDTTGLELLRILQHEGLNVPTILITGQGSEQVAADAFRLGVQDYLTKPIDANELEKAIARALTESRLRREKTKLTEQLKDQVSWLTALTKVGQSITSTLNLDELLRRIVEAGVLLTRADEGFLALLDKESGQLYLRAEKNIDTQTIKTMRLPVTDSLMGDVIRNKTPLRASQSTSGSLLKVSTGYLVRSLLHVPILSKGVPLGVLSVDNRLSVRAFQEKDETVLRSLADYAAIALENTNLYRRTQQELTERQRVEAALRESEERYALAVRGANDGLWDWDMKAQQIYYSPRWKSMLGYEEAQIDTDPGEWFSRVHPDDIEQLKTKLTAHFKGQTPYFESEYRMKHKDGVFLWMLSRGIAVWDKDGLVSRVAGSQTDITARKTAEQKLVHDALYDSLSGLPNRTLFTDRLRHAIEIAKRRANYKYAVLFLDIDRFKDINDSLGHSMGDQLLVATGRLLADTLRPGDTVARIGGDEYVILLEDINSVNDATLVADRIQEKLMTTPLLPEHTLFVTASIGIVLSVSGYDQAEDVLRDADIAMYRAKDNGRGRYEIFDLEMREHIIERMRLERELRQALEHDELAAYYQPIVSLQDGHLIGFEALARWQHPRRGLLLPKAFIPLAEETGLVIQIDRWILRQACQQIQKWQQAFTSNPSLSINVNLSGKQVAQPDLADFIERTLEETGLEASRLHVEITENALMENFEHTADLFKKLRNLDVRIKIDDFGIGYSSLNYLSRFPVDALKIDHSFIGQMDENPAYMKIVQAIIRLAHSMGMSVVAEGVETQGQLAHLKELGCEYMQGSLVALPVDQQTARALIEKFAAGENAVYG